MTDIFLVLPATPRSPTDEYSGPNTLGSAKIIPSKATVATTTTTIGNLPAGGAAANADAPPNANADTTNIESGGDSSSSVETKIIEILMSRMLNDTGKPYIS